MKPLAIDLFCGLGGWTDGLLAEGYNVMPGGKGRGVGFKPSAESVERSAAKHRGLPCHPNTLAAAIARRGQRKPAGHGAKVAAALRGVPRSGATKAKLSAYWAKRRANGEFKTAAPYAHARKAASAAIARIPLPLARHIARTWKPMEAAS